jgi:hypothetical protein
MLLVARSNLDPLHRMESGAPPDRLGVSSEA